MSRPIHILTAQAGSDIGTLHRLEEAGNAYQAIATGKAEDLRELMDYLEAGEKELHGE
ncbi:hypothetical protein QEH44_gp65 [Arthrobacter phage Shambre1]|uniref:Uncharacterized protein n=1 Tax=Arthrobacter phage Shambre1 TaxID=2927284 RepID=A0A977KQ16_9CAUD|nr:hypothetical protein QEH44_gp65 [Arthrobacter phage Shambre1]UXE04801.1 hypothetical protein SEA_SHAMBRE1_65 [Arthrobacter phage Shambre1]